MKQKMQFSTKTIPALCLILVSVLCLAQGAAIVESSRSGTGNPGPVLNWDKNSNTY